MDVRPRRTPRISDRLLVVQLQQRTGRSDGQVRRALAELEHTGWVSRRIGRDGARVPGTPHPWALTEGARADARVRLGVGAVDASGRARR